MAVVRCLMYLFKRPNNPLKTLGQLNKYIRHRTAVISQLTSRGAAAIHSQLLTPWAKVWRRFAAGKGILPASGCSDLQHSRAVSEGFLLNSKPVQNGQQKIRHGRIFR